MKDMSYKCIKMTAHMFGTVKTEGKGLPMVVRRVPTDEARRLVATAGWQFAPRSEWKVAGRKYGLGLAGE